MKFALFYEIPVAEARGRPTRSTRPTRTRSSRRCSATRWASTRSGRSSTTSSRSTRTARTPRCSTARSRRAPRTSASATACACCRSRTTTRSAPPSRWRCSTSSPTAASSSAPAARRRAPSSRASTSTRDETREMWREALGHIVGAWTEDEYQADGQVLADGRASAACCPKPLQQPHPPIWGATSSLPGHDEIGQQRHRAVLVHRRPPARGARRTASRSTARASPSASSRSASSSTTPRRRSRWCTARRRTRRPPRSPQESFVWYPKLRRRPHRVGRRVAWRSATARDLGTYEYTGDAAEARSAKA